MTGTIEGREVAKRGGPRPGSGRPKTSERDDVTVKLDRSVAAKARYVAEVKGVPLAEYLSTITSSVVDRDFAKASTVKAGDPNQPN